MRWTLSLPKSYWPPPPAELQLQPPAPTHSLWQPINPAGPDPSHYSSGRWRRVFFFFCWLTPSIGIEWRSLLAEVHIFFFSGVSFSQRASTRPVSEAGYPIWAAREDLDMFRAFSAALYWNDEGQTPGPAAALCSLHHIKGTDQNFGHYCIGCIGHWFIAVVRWKYYIFLFYLLLQITKEEHTFQDIMKCYRTQPQAHSHVSISSLAPSIIAY